MLNYIQNQVVNNKTPEATTINIMKVNTEVTKKFFISIDIKDSDCIILSLDCVSNKDMTMLYSSSNIHYVSHIFIYCYHANIVSYVLKINSLSIFKG